MFNIFFKELKISFITPFAYGLIAGFMALSGFFFFSLLQNFNYISAKATSVLSVQPNLNEWVIIPYFQTLEIILLFLVPILTMRIFYDEKKNGTFEMLIISPVSILNIVLGKYLAICIVAFFAIFASFLFCLPLTFFTTVEVWPIFIGYLGLVFSLFAFIAITIATASILDGLTITGIVSLVTLLIFYAIDAPLTQVHSSLGNFLTFLAPSSHALNLFKGILRSEDIIYFLSVIFFGLFISTRALERYRI